LRFKRPSNTRHHQRQLPLDQLLSCGRVHAWLQEALQNMREKQPALLELAEYRVRGLPLPGNLQRVQQVGHFTLEVPFRAIKKRAVSLGRNSAEQQRLDVHGT